MKIKTTHNLYIIVAFIIAGIGALVLPLQRVFAHELQIDNTIGAVLHVDPEDDPIAGDSSKIYLEFKDTQGKLVLSQCDCSVDIISNGTTIISKHVSDADVVASNQTLSFAYVFPTMGIYTIQVTGSPLKQFTASSTAFDSFVLKYDIRVERQSTTNISTTSSMNAGGFLGMHALHIILFGGAILLSLFIIATDKSGRKHV